MFYNQRCIDLNKHLLENGYYFKICHLTRKEKQKFRSYLEIPSLFMTILKEASQRLYPALFLAFSIDKLKTKYHLFCKVYGHQLDMVVAYLRKTLHDFTWPSDHVVIWGHITNWKLTISSSTRPLITKHCRVVTYDDGNSTTMSRNSEST